MYPTYLDLKRNLLARLGEDRYITADGAIIECGTVQGYFKQLPALLGEALILLATAGKFLRRVITLPTGEGRQGFDLEKLAPGFFSLTGCRVWRDGEPYADYRLEGRSRIIFPSGEGEYRVEYNAYPEPLPETIGDDYELRCDPETYAILPLYLEGKLRMIDDEDYAVTVLNEFEQRRTELQAMWLDAPAVQVVTGRCAL